MATKKNLTAADTVKLDAYALIERAVAEGVAVGVMRAFKHTDAPDREQLNEGVSREVMSALSTVFVWGE